MLRVRACEAAVRRGADGQQTEAAFSIPRETRPLPTPVAAVGAAAIHMDN